MAFVATAFIDFFLATNRSRVLSLEQDLTDLRKYVSNRMQQVENDVGERKIDFLARLFALLI